VLQQYGSQLYVGDIEGADQETSSWSADRPDISPTAFGDMVPYGDPTWYMDWNSPYYKESHRRFRREVREFTEKEVMPFCHDWDERRAVPRDLWEKCYQAGWLPAIAGLPWPTNYVGDRIAGGVKPEEFDAFHELILMDEVSRSGCAGVLWCFAGLAIGLPPIIRFGSKYLQDKVAEPCLTGKKIICLAITEPGAGSDVASLSTTAKKTPDGKFYIVNGEKKFITNGVWSDFFTVAVRTGDAEGMGGISLLLLERTMPGITTRLMNMSGAWGSGTTFITFEDVKVPVENLIGKENKGFKYIMYNFNTERWGTIVAASRFARVCYEEAFKYAHKRKTFGQLLVNHPVIRLKLADMARQCEALHCWIEHITYQMCTMNHEEAMIKLGGPMALLKAHATKTLEFCAREAMQVLGGIGYTRGGQGEKVERLYREVRAYAIAAGSEEIMLELGMRQAKKMAKMFAKM